MKEHIWNLIAAALSSLQQEGILSSWDKDRIQVQRTRDKSHGDFASNIPMVLAKEARQKPQKLADLIVARLPEHPWVKKVDIAGPGFINFTLALPAFQAVVSQILEQKEFFGRCQTGQGKTVHLEFVSANPTGPLHVGHGRGAAYGDALARLLTAVGYQVHREYYVNDAGRQMDILAVSVWLRYLELCGETLPFPSNGYQGEYVCNIGQYLKIEEGDLPHHSAKEILAGLPADAPEGDREKYLDALILKMKNLLGKNNYRKVFEQALNTILAGIREDLAKFNVTYDEWFSERQLTKMGMVKIAIERLKAAGYLYQKDGAWWFRATNFGDEKDRVVIRENGQPTYFASDIAYHLNKLERGYHKIIDVWGADHHGYIPRIKASLQALGADLQQFDVRLVQFAILYRGKEKIQMSTRSGEFVTLRELCQEVGKDAARFFYVMRGAEQHMDFDLELAKSQSNENPVYYVQYAHARICSVFHQLKAREFVWNSEQGRKHLGKLNESHEVTLLDRLSCYSEVVEGAATQSAPHLLAYYLLDLARDFHTYYNAHTFLVDTPELRDARLALIAATRQVIKNGLTLLGVSAPESM
ncbi:arginine--tRNA ligase [Nitrosococcus watsonii]|uniref:Arginine--tRNA ligase n=1 Tax=Nitrosococcus watsoni (strain C-113) TaxID=105559 RepID=D8K821_NITWC|nr:arginine--tRNA ligase [Nitrosococcus watsonii]ADJ27016.1 arginyl-tRNA synthetase [Nitrosococcus watsonii C-113]